MKKILLALIVIFTINTLAVSALAKINIENATTSGGAIITDETDKNHIVIKENQDNKYSGKIDATIAVLEKNIVQSAGKYGFDFNSIIKELKSNKKSIVSNVYNQKIENNNIKYEDLLNKTYDSLYSQYGKKLTTYTKESFNELLDKKLNNKIKPGETASYTILIAVQNKNTGLFISYAPINLKIGAAYDKLDRQKIVYTAEIQSLSCMQMAND